MANSYQLVAWTDKCQVRIIPSEVTAYFHAEMDAIDRMADRSMDWRDSSACASE